jgi:N-acetylmuramoyl-L-alanine amidase
MWRMCGALVGVLGMAVVEALGPPRAAADDGLFDAVPVPAAPRVVERVEVLPEPELAVRLHLSAATSVRFGTVAHGEDVPDRIYVDVPGARLGRDAVAAAGAGPLLRVRTGQFEPHVARIVLDLAQPLPFAVREDGRTVTVTLGVPAEPRPLAAVVPLPAPPPAAAPAPVVPAAPVVPPPEVASEAPVAPANPPPPPVPPLASTPRPDDPLRAQSVPVIIVDPGHGGRDPGAAGVGGVVEKDLVLELSLRLTSRLLARLPVTVVLTRTDDSFLPIDRRLPPTPDEAALFLSLHANACEDASARGLEVFYGGGSVRPASLHAGGARAALLGRCLEEALRTRVGLLRGDARPGAFGILARNPLPSALVEVGYLTHPGDAARAQDPEYQDLLVDALVDGIAAFLAAARPPL